MQKYERSYRFTEKEIKQLVKDLYGLQVSSITPLDSYIDQNSLLTDENGKKYVLKIAHPEEEREVMAAQTGAMEYLAANNTTVTCPKVCPTRTGQSISSIKTPTGTPHLVRLVTYIPGTFFAQLGTHSPELLVVFEMGHQEHNRPRETRPPHPGPPAAKPGQILCPTIQNLCNTCFSKTSHRHYPRRCQQ